jgi:hypothetical protein
MVLENPAEIAGPIGNSTSPIPIVIRKLKVPITSLL